jgi:hypothetical protein
MPLLQLIYGFGGALALSRPKKTYGPIIYLLLQEPSVSVFLFIINLTKFWWRIFASSRLKKI